MLWSMVMLQLAKDDCLLEVSCCGEQRLADPHLVLDPFRRIPGQWQTLVSRPRSLQPAMPPPRQMMARRSLVIPSPNPHCGFWIRHFKSTHQSIILVQVPEPQQTGNCTCASLGNLDTVSLILAVSTKQNCVPGCRCSRKTGSPRQRFQAPAQVASEPRYANGILSGTRPTANDAPVFFCRLLARSSSRAPYRTI